MRVYNDKGKLLDELIIQNQYTSIKLTDKHIFQYTYHQPNILSLDHENPGYFEVIGYSERFNQFQFSLIVGFAILIKFNLPTFKRGYKND